MSLLAQVDSNTARSPPERPADEVREALALMRLGVEAALVGRELVPGDVEILDGHIGRVRPPVFQTAREWPLPASSISR